MKEHMKEFIFLASISFGLMAILSLLYELWWWCTALLFIEACLVVPAIVRYKRKAEKEQEIYEEVTTYLEQLLCSYKRTGQIVTALSDCGSIFEDEEIKEVINQSLNILKTGEGVEDGHIVREALRVMENKYQSRRMQLIHEFISQVDDTGGDRDDSLDILLEEVQLWKRRTLLYQKKKKYIRVDTMIAVVLSMLMCYLSKMLTPDELGLNLPSTWLYQISTIFVLSGFLFTIFMIWKKLTGTWLDEEVLTEENRKSLEKQYDILKGNVVNPNRIKQMLSMHLAKKICKRQVKQEFPYWILNVTLQMQTESIYQSIAKSMEGLSPVMKRETKKLMAEIYQSPSALLPYLDFFKELHLVDVQSGMKILYSVGQNGYEESRRQLDFLVTSNNQLMDQSETHRFENQTAGLSMLKHVPMLIACVKLVADLVNLLSLTMGMFQTIV